jgi:hypothetical protein
LNMWQTLIAASTATTVPPLLPSRGALGFASMAIDPILGVNGGGVERNPGPAARADLPRDQRPPARLVLDPLEELEPAAEKASSGAPVALTLEA